MTYFEDLAGSFRGMALAYALSLLGDRGLAEDAVQEAMLDAYVHLDQLRERQAFPSWFRRIVLKHADRQRRRRLLAVEFHEVPGAVDPLATLIEGEQRRTIQDGIDSLPPGLKAAITLHYQGELSIAEVADFLQITPGAVRKRLFDGRTRLRDRLVELSEGRSPRQLEKTPTQTTGGAFMTELIETGIKAIDLYAPIPRGGTLAIRGEPGAGQVVVALEVVHNLAERHAVRTACYTDGDVVQLEAALSESGIAGSVTSGKVAGTVFEVTEVEGSELVARVTVGDDPGADSWLELSREMLKNGQLPAVDSAGSGTRSPLGEHAELAAAARAAVADRTLEGASVLAYLRQWFSIAERFTGQPGEYVPMAQTLSATRHLLA